MALHIVLVEPEIPQNTGNIARTCAATGTVLHLVGPLGFEINDKHLKRAGLDYWNDVEIHHYETLNHFLTMNGHNNLYYATTKGANIYSDVIYPRDAFILFGKETKGLPEELLTQHLDQCIRIPMKEKLRSLNLANSAAIVAYEYYRQNGFSNFQTVGKLGKA